jgi:hypothetical protein
VREEDKSSSSYRVLRLVRDGERERWRENSSEMKEYLVTVALK